MLSPYRALDLTDHQGYLCGKILGDLGADVIKVERPGGDPGRQRGPFWGEQPHPERSLYWMAFNTSKRGITLNIEHPQGQELLLRMVEKTDFVLESFPPGYLKGLGLGYGELSKHNSGVILASITPFGQTGPRSHYKGSDIVAMALSGVMSVIGDPDRAPLRFPGDQAYLLAGANAAVGCLMALYHRQLSDQGQHVDVSTQESLLRLYCREFPQWELRGSFMKRLGPSYPRTDVAFPGIFPCRDGYVTWLLYAGAAGVEENRALVRWMEESEFPQVDKLRPIDWDRFDYAKITQAELDSWYQVFAAFFLTQGKGELEKEAARRKVRLIAVRDIPEATQNQQLASRDYWVPLEHRELGTSLLYPGRSFQLSAGECRVRSRAPLLGEHNGEVYPQLLGLSPEELQGLASAGVI